MVFVLRSAPSQSANASPSSCNCAYAKISRFSYMLPTKVIPLTGGTKESRMRGTMRALKELACSFADYSGSRIEHHRPSR